VRKRSALYLVDERGNDDVLTYYPVEADGAVFAVKLLKVLRLLLLVAT